MSLFSLRQRPNRASNRPAILFCVLLIAAAGAGGLVGCGHSLAPPLAGARLVRSGSSVTGLDLSLRVPACAVALAVGEDGAVSQLLPGAGRTPERLQAGAGRRLLLENPIGIPAGPDRGARIVVGVFEDPPATEALLAGARSAAERAGADPKERSYACLRALDEAGGSGVVLPLAAE